MSTVAHKRAALVFYRNPQWTRDLMPSSTDGFDDLDATLKALTGKVRAKVWSEIVGGAEDIRADAIRSIQSGSKSGEIYKRRSVEHQASAPGEAPATDTGNLVTNLNARYFENDLRAEIGIHDLTTNGAPYARRLELGGRDKRGVYIAPRPFLQPAYDKNVKQIVKAIAKAVNKGAR
jgi:hypothetical protein